MEDLDKQKEKEEMNSEMNHLEEEYRVFTGDAKTMMKQLLEKYVIVKSKYPKRINLKSRIKIEYKRTNQK